MDQIGTLTATDFCFTPDGKWSAAQQLDHIIRSVKPVNMALGLPPFLLKLLFGTANRPSKTFEALTEKYNRKLQEGGRATGRFIPESVAPEQKIILLTKLKEIVDKLCHKIENYNEEVLDKCILPHPLLGKLTLREMLYFTAYHAEHHRGLVEKGLLQKEEIKAH